MTNSLRIAAIFFLVISGLIWHDFRAFAQGSSSTYRIDESFIGPGGELESSSGNYQLQTGQQAVGNSGVDTGTSTNFQVLGGSVTPSEPTLRCVINTSSLNLGSLSIASTATATASFSVLNYTTYGYNVSIVGTPPATGGHQLTPLSSNASSQTGNEQFGINLVRNIDFFSPGSHLGSDPLQVPSSAFSFGAAATSYNSSGSFRYNSGETIATATKESGQTDFTISYIVNVATTTPGGSYSGNQAIVCTGTY